MPTYNKYYIKFNDKMQNKYYIKDTVLLPLTGFCMMPASVMCNTVNIIRPNSPYAKGELGNVHVIDSTKFATKEYGLSTSNVNGKVNTIVYDGTTFTGNRGYILPKYITGSELKALVSKVDKLHGKLSDFYSDNYRKLNLSTSPGYMFGSDVDYWSVTFKDVVKILEGWCAKLNDDDHIYYDFKIGRPLTDCSLRHKKLITGLYNYVGKEVPKHTDDAGAMYVSYKYDIDFYDDNVSIITTKELLKNVKSVNTVKGDVTFVKGLLENTPTEANLKIYTNVLLGYDWDDKETAAYPLYSCIYLQKRFIDVIGELKKTIKGKQIVSTYGLDYYNIGENAEWLFFRNVKEKGLTVPDDLRCVVDSEIDRRLRGWLRNYFSADNELIEYYKRRYRI